MVGNKEGAAEARNPVRELVKDVEGLLDGSETVGKSVWEEKKRTKQVDKNTGK